MSLWCEQLFVKLEIIARDGRHYSLYDQIFDSLKCRQQTEAVIFKASIAYVLILGRCSRMINIVHSKRFAIVNMRGILVEWIMEMGNALRFKRSHQTTIMWHTESNSDEIEPNQPATYLKWCVWGWEIGSKVCWHNLHYALSNATSPLHTKCTIGNMRILHISARVCVSVAGIGGGGYVSSPPPSFRSTTFC